MRICVMLRDGMRCFVVYNSALRGKVINYTVWGIDYTVEATVC